MNSALYANYLNILKQELVPALGCTEPIAIAYAAAKAHQVLGEFPDSVNMSLSGNIIKNVKGVTVPNSGGLKGIDVEVVYPFDQRAGTDMLFDQFSGSGNVIFCDFA